MQVRVWVAKAMFKGCWAMCKGCRGNVLTCENKANSFSVQLKVELGLQVGEEFDKNLTSFGGSYAKLMLV